MPDLVRAFLHWVASVDLSVYHFLNGYAGNWFLDHLAGFEEGNQLFKGVAIVAAYVYLWFRSTPEQEQRRKTILAILVGTLLALVVCRSVANLTPFRERPMYDPAIAQQPHAVSISYDNESWSSFPSDTAAYFGGLVFGLAYCVRRYAIPLALYAAVWICLPRMFLGEHYLSDIVVGSAIGSAAVWSTARSEWLRSKFAGWVLAFMEAQPAVFYAAAFLVCFELAYLFHDVRSFLRGLLHLRLAGPFHGLFGLVLGAGAILGLILASAYGASQALHRHRSRAALAGVAGGRAATGHPPLVERGRDL